TSQSGLPRRSGPALLQRAVPVDRATARSSFHRDHGGDLSSWRTRRFSSAQQRRLPAYDQRRASSEEPSSASGVDSLAPDSLGHLGRSGHRAGGGSDSHHQAASRDGLPLL